MGAPAELEITCRQVLREISNYLENEVSPVLRERLEQHLRNCHHCTAVLDGTRNTITLVADQRAFELPAETSRRLYARLTSMLAERK